MTEENNAKWMPQSELDFNLMTTDAVWGSDYVSPELKARLKRTYPDKINPETGELELDKESLWGILGIYTRDMRLANLSEWNGELSETKFFLNLAADLLGSGYIDAFLIAISRVATNLELSQSKGGFLRKRMTTLTSESYNQQLDPPKKGLFGKSKPKE